MAQVVCPRCCTHFDPTNHKATAAGAAAGAALGAAAGARIGIVGGPGIALAGTIPGAVIGGLLGGLGVLAFAKCPRCGHTFKI